MMFQLKGYIEEDKNSIDEVDDENNKYINVKVKKPFVKIKTVKINQN